MRSFDRLEKHLVAALERALDKKPARVPEAGRLLWQWFIALSETRTYHMAGPNPISFGEIEAFARLHRWPIEPRHVAIIRAMDAAWLAHAMARSGAGADKAAIPLSAAQDINPAAFDAVFG